MAYAPVATGAQLGFAIPQVAAAQRLLGLRIAPAAHLDMAGCGANAGDFRESLEQLVLHARGLVFEVFF